jgi:alanine racemase
MFQVVPRFQITHQSRPLRAVVHSLALQHNYQLLKKKAGAPLWATLKANAYGHGLLHTAQALKQLADGFAVLEMEEALCLRQAGFDHPILILEGAFVATDWDLAIEHQLTMVIHNENQIKWLAKRVPSLSQNMAVYLKTNTGMNRLGFSIPATYSAYKQLSTMGLSITLMTHYACADEGKNAVLGQNNQFQALVRQLNPPAISCSNSAALLQGLSARDHWMRSGLALYGSSPIESVSAQTLDLRPAMNLESEIISIQTLAPGDSVGYGARFMAEAPLRIGIVACGYADGYPRTAPLGTPMLVDGIKTRLIGRVSMDMLAVD